MEFIMVNKKSFYFSILVLLSGLLAFVVLLLNRDIALGYDKLCLFPFVYMLLSIYTIKILNEKKRFYKTTSVFLFIQWLRLVLLPLIGSVSGYFDYYGSYSDEESVDLAIYLVLLETVITFCISIMFISTNREIITNDKIYRLRGSKYVYFIFVLIAAATYAFSNAKNYHFFMLNLSESRLSTSIGHEGNVLGAIIDYGLTILVILLLYYCYKNYIKSCCFRYVLFGLTVASIRLSLISSEGRMSQLYLLGVFLMILPNMFKKYKNIIIKYILLIATVIIGLMTVYKTYYAFLYSSYLEAIQANSFRLQGVASQIDIYFYGVKTISKNLYFCLNSDISISQFFIDTLKNTFGIHYLFKNNTYTTIENYNLFLYSGDSTSGYLFSSLAYGYLMFGVIIAPFASAANVFLTYIVEKYMSRITDLDIYYIFCIIYTRMLLTLFSNFPQTWNMVSRTMIIMGIVIGGSYFIKFLYKKGYI